MKNNKLLFLSIVAASAAQTADAQHISLFNIESRFGYELESFEGKVNNDNTGFKGQYLLFRIDGELTESLSFSYRQRLNKNTDQTFWDATDWFHVDWKATDWLTLSGGKQVVLIGGYEYDRAPIDLYYCSEFWNNIFCYQLGASAAVDVTTRDQLVLQLCNSPFRTWAGNNTYGVNLIWYGKHGVWETMSSVNMLQYSRTSWINYIAIGNKFNLSRSLSLELDLMNRAASGQTFLLKDCSVMGELSYQSDDKLRLFAKYTYDVNHSGIDADYMVMDGSELSLFSAGVEVQPIEKYRDSFRLFTACSYSLGTNSNPAGTMLNRQLLAEAGVKLKLDILSGLKKLNK